MNDGEWMVRYHANLAQSGYVRQQILFDYTDFPLLVAQTRGMAIIEREEDMKDWDYIIPEALIAMDRRIEWTYFRAGEYRKTEKSYLAFADEADAIMAKLLF